MLAVLLAGICGISAFSENEFRYTKIDLQSDKCNVCYHLQCYTMDKARCSYYSLASDITGNNIHEYEMRETPNEIIDEVDDMIFEYTEKASNAAVYKDCIPLISQYTNCNRDNICSGCKTCNCDSEGRWNCSQIQHCRPVQDIPMDHHTMVVMMEKLNDYKNTITNVRNKRSVVEDKKREVMNPEEVVKWMYEVKELDRDEDFLKTTTEVDSNLTKRNNSVENSFLSSWSNKNEKNDNESESQPLVFEDLLNNLNLKDDKIHLSLEDKSPHSENIMYDFPQQNALNDITSSFLADTTILDDDYQRNKSDTDQIIDNVFAYINLDMNDNFNYKRDISHNARLEKRDVGIQSINVTIPDNNTDQVIAMQNIMVPFNNIIQQKQEELNKLIDIREKLNTYIKPFANININNTVTNISNENINLYLLQLSSIQNFDDFRKRDQNNLNEYLRKFKRDIHEVVRDIARIQRLSNSAIPYDLKILFQAMKNYVGQDTKRKKIINANNHNTIDLRKKFDTNIGYKTDIKPIDEIINILELLDSDMPTFDILKSLTPAAKKILTRLIHTFYKNDLTSMDSRINKAFNLTLNLEGIGQNFNEMTINIATNSLPERLYSMRLFHLVLSLDIDKIEDALAMLQFSQNRRMALIDDITGERLIERIDDSLKKSDRRLNHIIQKQTQKLSVNNTEYGKKKSKKKTFLQHIKTLLRNSKMDIRKLMHRKVPKSQIVKHIAKKKIDELRKNKLAEYEQTMQRWQSNLNIISRNKRAASFQDFMNSIKNLIPGFRKSYKKKVNKTKEVKKRSLKRGRKKAYKITPTTQKTRITTEKQK